MNKHKVVILGAGVAGLAASYECRKRNIDNIIIEKESDYGGLCGGFDIEGFHFDYFGHVEFEKDPYTRFILEEGIDYYTHKPMSYNYDRGYWLKHPVQNNLYPLPVEEKIRHVKGFCDRKKVTNGEIDNYEEWLYSMYGYCFSNYYPKKYTRKYWTIEAKELETSWVGERMYVPTIDEVLKGAMTSETPEVHYSKEARYPIYGGFKAFLKNLECGSNILFNANVSNIDAESKTIELDGKIIQYDTLISTIPLPELIDVLKNVPVSITNATNNLDYTTGVMVSVGLDIPDVGPSLWFYIYDEDIEPARVYATHRKSINNVPNGYSGLQAEIYFSKYKPLEKPLEEIKCNVIEQLVKMGLFKTENVLFSDVRMKKYANIMFTHGIQDNRKLIHRFLDSIGIDYAGRFGEWDYLWVGQSIRSGIDVADKIIREVNG